MDIGYISAPTRKHITASQEFFKQKAKEGWQYTCFGWLSPEDIKASDIYYDLKIKEWVIPVYVNFAQETKNGRRKGDKFYAPSPKFFKWFKTRQRVVPETIDETIDKQIEIEEAKEVSPETKQVIKDFKNYHEREVNIDNIHF